jgi:hypothetical protein
MAKRRLCILYKLRDSAATSAPNLPRNALLVHVSVHKSGLGKCLRVTFSQS